LLDEETIKQYTRMQIHGRNQLLGAW